MSKNPFEPPEVASHARKQRRRGLSWWFVGAVYLLPLTGLVTLMNHDGWYGTGYFGMLQVFVRVALFSLGTGCACTVLLRGRLRQVLSVVPASLCYCFLLVLMILSFTEII